MTRYKEYITCRISFSKFSDVLTTFTYARAIGSLWNIYFGVNILSYLRLDTLPTQTKIFGRPFSCVCFPFGNITLSKALRTFYLQLRSIIAFLRVSAVFLFLTVSFGFVDPLKISRSSFNFICCLKASSRDKLSLKFLLQKILFF